MQTRIFGKGDVPEQDTEPNGDQQEGFVVFGDGKGDKNDANDDHDQVPGGKVGKGRITQKLLELTENKIKNSAVHNYAPISINTSPSITDCPGLTLMATMVPCLSESMLFSIFMASKIISF